MGRPGRAAAYTSSPGLNLVTAVPIAATTPDYADSLTSRDMKADDDYLRLPFLSSWETSSFREGASSSPAPAVCRLSVENRRVL